MSALRLLARRRSGAAETSARRRALTPEQLHGALREIGWGLLATDAAGQPYAVPIAYGFDGRRIYIGTGPGRKLRTLEQNPRICLTVADVVSLSDWVSIVITGQVRWVERLPDRARAIRALVQQRRSGRRLGADQAPRLARARLAYIEIESMTGRCSRSSSGGSVR
jgi:nitroimidazol reductase NimA-like FMN-containing flavoprotein (pyridoxamine 5'-phosphate oxidase superfamily)